MTIAVRQEKQAVVADGMNKPSSAVRAPRRSRRALPRLALLALLASAVAVCLHLAPLSSTASTLGWRFRGKDRKTTYTLVLLRHGESEWNLENRFTGWVDVDLSEKGLQEGKYAGELLREAGITVDMAFTSVQKRAIKTCMLALEEMDLLWIPVVKSWKLNERMYGNLQGGDKKEAVKQYGEEQVKLWRRSYAVPPPSISDDSPYHPSLDAKYAGIPKKNLPLAESLKMTVERVVPYWKSRIVPELKTGKVVMVAAHGNSLRALVKYLDGLSDEEITKLNIPTGVPLIYKLNADFQPIAMGDHADSLSGVYLGDQAWVQGKISGVANQAKR